MEIKEFTKNRYNYEYKPKTALVAKFLEDFARIVENESKLLPIIPKEHDTWIGFAYDADKLLYELAKLEDPKEFVRGFEVGRNSVLRKNQSGCVCVIDENDKMIAPCLFHKMWKEEK